MFDNNPKLKKAIHRLLIHPYSSRPRWWTRTFVNPFFIKRGKGTIIRSKSRLDIIPSKKFQLGTRCIVEDYAIINNQMGDIIIGDNSRILSKCIVIGPVIIGKNVIMAPGSQISGLTHNYKDINIPISLQGVSTQLTTIEGDVWVGANSCINTGVTIGEHSMITPNSFVIKSVPAYSVVGGNPARIIKRYNHDKGEWEKVPKS